MKGTAVLKCPMCDWSVRQEFVDNEDEDLTIAENMTKALAIHLDMKHPEHQEKGKD